MDDLRFPSTIAFFGSDIAQDDAEAKYYMLTVDERAVSRKYSVTLHDNIWKRWRDATGFPDAMKVLLEMAAIL